MFKQIIRVSILLLLYILSQKLFAQSPNFRHITNKEGLPSMTVYDIMQDKKGYIWLGTEAGMCKYDGYKFEILHIPGSRGKAFTNFMEDNQGRIYCANFGNQIFSIYRDKIKEIKLPNSSQELKIKDYLLDSKNQLWILTDELYCYNPKTKKWKIHSLSKIKSTDTRHQSIEIDSQDRIWFWEAFTSTLYLIKDGKIQEKAIQRKLPFANSFTILNDDLYLFNISQNKYYICNKNKKIWQDSQLDISHFPKEYIVNGILTDNEKNIWVIGNEGTVCFGKTRQLFDSKLFLLKNKYVSRIIQDFEGNYWFATVGNGVYMMPNKDILNYNAENSILEFQQINCLAEDNEHNVIVGANGNKVFKFNTQQELIHMYQLPKGDVECMLFDKQNQDIFIENGLLHTFSSKETTHRYTISAGSTPKDIALYQDNFLVVAAGNFAIIISKDGTPRQLRNSKYYDNFLYDDYSIVLRNTRSRTVCVDKSNDRIWVGYADGLYYYEDGQEYELKTKNNQSIIAIDLVFHRGKLWVGTIQQGILMLNDLKIEKQFTTENALISNFCRVVRPDKNKFWIGTDKGIQVWNFEKNTSYTINQKDGLTSNEVHDLLIQDTLVWVASSEGLTIFEKNHKVIHKTPRIYITGFVVDEEKQSLQKKYHLNYDKNNIKIDFRGISFKSEGQFQYKYRMLGLDNEWISIESATNFVRFASLLPGKYTFEVKAVSSAGVESRKTARISIEIAYPIWQKWWFIALMVSLGILLISMIFRWRIRAIHRRNNLKHQLIDANLKALKTQMNPHFIFNSLGSIQDFILQDKTEEAERYVAKFAKLTRQILEASRQKYICIAEEIEILENYLLLEQAFSEHKFEYQFHISEDIDEDTIKIPPLFAQPFIENSLKHGISSMDLGGKIEISFSFHHKLILLEISDNGIGREKAQSIRPTKKHHSLATQITNERIELLQRTIAKSVQLEIGDIVDANHKIIGTKVKLLLPYTS